MTRETPPPRDDGEVWVKPYSERGSGKEKAFHTHENCRHLKESENVRAVPRRTLNQGWDICHRCAHLHLPDRSSGEYWIANNASHNGARKYHYDATCYRVQLLNSPKTVPEIVTDRMGLSECQDCGDDYLDNKGKEGSRLATLLKRDDVTPENYQEKVAEWQANREGDAS
jgi:hypothetical protein